MQLDLHRTRGGLRNAGRRRARFPKTFACEFYTGVVYAHVKNYPEAIRHFKEAEVIGLATDPALLDQRFYFQFGEACERDQHLQTGRGISAKVHRSLAPDFGEALNYLGYMLADRGEQLPRARALDRKGGQARTQKRRLS